MTVLANLLVFGRPILDTVEDDYCDKSNPPEVVYNHSSSK